jgi:hypothetical protein
MDERERTVKGRYVDVRKHATSPTISCGTGAGLSSNAETEQNLQPRLQNTVSHQTSRPHRAQQWALQTDFSIHLLTTRLLRPLQEAQIYKGAPALFDAHSHHGFPVSGQRSRHALLMNSNVSGRATGR